MPRRIIDKFDGWLIINHERLKEAIKALPPKKRTYQAIKEKTGINPQQLSEYLIVTRHQILLNFKRLCLYTGISADELLGIGIVDDETLPRNK